jgi:AraC-like DNA-binding protein
MGQWYREDAPPADLRAAVACLWQQRAGTPWRQRVVPDGCVDLIWLAEGSLVVAGADTGPRTVSLPADTLTSGVRLRPGAAGAFLGLPAAEVRDRDTPAVDLLGPAAATLADGLHDAAPRDRLRLLATAVRDRHVTPDPLVVAAARGLATPGARVAEVAATLGVTERTLHRRTLAAVGYPPKTLARVLRLRRLSEVGGTLADRALAAGYAHQAHMSDEVRELTGLTPARYLVRFPEDEAVGAA